MIELAVVGNRIMTAQTTMLPCAHCGSVTHERESWGGLSDVYCVDDAACQARRFEIEREKAQRENVKDDK